MKILITGATGFIGTALEQRLGLEGHQVVGLGRRQCDLTRSDALAPWSSIRFDQIYHLAAWTQAGDFCLHHPGEQWIRNQQINTHVLAWWADCQPQAKMIAMGTSCAYPTDRRLVEENYLAGLPTESLFTYAMSKRMLHVGLMSLARQMGLSYLCLVPSTVYGPDYHTDSRQMHFIFDLIRKILRAKLTSEPAVLWGDGHQTRELIYRDDLIDAMLHLSVHAHNELVNVGSGEEHSIRHFARAICDEVGYDFDKLEFDTSAYVGARSKCLQVGKLRRLYPGLRQTPLTVGLSRTIAWFWSHREQLFSPRSATKGAA